MTSMLEVYNPATGEKSNRFPSNPQRKSKKLSYARMRHFKMVETSAAERAGLLKMV
ncbi:hypothetical protein PO124_30240 [Bacillus licheniformis]|nr:hypothetical protein [Bacillus licheniformis]